MQVGYLKLSNVSKVLDFLRIFKWYKNVLLFIPSLLVLGVIPTLLNINLVVAFILLGMVSSGLYIINDVADKSADRKHPTKKKRLVASGKIKTEDALLIGVAILFTFAIPLRIITGWVFVYIMSTLLYISIFRNIPIADSVNISTNSIIRLLIGYSIIGIAPDPSLLALAFFFTMFTSISKRIREYIETNGKLRYKNNLDNITLLDMKIWSLLSVIAIGMSLILSASYIGVLTAIILSVIIARMEIYTLYNPLKTGSFKTLIKDKSMIVMLVLLVVSLFVKVTV